MEGRRDVAMGGWRDRGTERWREASPVTRAVHGLEGEGLLLHFEGEHVLAVVLPVSGGLPQLAVVDVGRHHLLEAPLAVLALQERTSRQVGFVVWCWSFTRLRSRVELRAAPSQLCRRCMSVSMQSFCQLLPAMPAPRLLLVEE